ncbi:MAG: hypothetical protein FWD69_11485 [Polyangiaceae bacterium]|nr:hypothetical protein [Polyangiaceae bacterium]
MTDSELQLSRHFLPEALAGILPVRLLGERDRRLLNQIRASGYVHLFDLFEGALASAVRSRATSDFQARNTIAPLLRLDSFDHRDLFRSFKAAFVEVFPVEPRYVQNTDDLARKLANASPHALLILALHLKLVTQQHYLACVRGDEDLEPHFVRLLKDHWAIERGSSPKGEERDTRSMHGSALAIQQALAHTAPESIPSALRDYRLLVFACDDVLRRQAELDIVTLEDVRRESFDVSELRAVFDAEVAAHRKAFLTVAIVNAAFVSAMRSMGPTAPAVLANVVSALSARS